MAPGSGKRKRPERQDSNHDFASRPSPHRPQNLGLAHAQQQSPSNARGGRRPSRPFGRGASSVPSSPSVTQPSPSAMGPPTTAIALSRTPLPPSPAPSPSPTSSQPASRPGAAKALRTNQYVTQERTATWSVGRNPIVAAGIQAQADGDMLTLGLVFEELVQSCLDSTVSPEELGSTVRDILAAPASDALDSASIFLDIISTLLPEDGILPPPIKLFLEATSIEPQRMRSVLENDVLATLGLVRPTFAKMAIRKATHALYRQSNYNLLREETEGYSKLITEYFTTVNTEPPSEEVVSATFLRVKALVGAFDLDVGRVLDVTLDVFANLLVKHNRFFVRLLRFSSWWPEQKMAHGIEWQESEVSALPRWALPGATHWSYSDEEREEQLRLREERDINFWKRVNGATRKGECIYPWLELGSRRITKSPPDIGKKADIDKSAKLTTEPSDFENIQMWTQEWISKTKTLPPSGNRIAAQLLGFKLRFYASDARDAHDTLPDNLIYLAALLIKIGFISLADLYPHLYPLDEDMEAHRVKLEVAKKEADEKKGGIVNNALRNAGALPDDTIPPPATVARLRESESKSSSKPESEQGTPPPKANETPKSCLPEPVDQKVALVRSLLCIGAVPDALFILSRFPWLLNVYPDLHRYIFRLAHHSISKMYEQARPFSQQDFSTATKQGHNIGSIAQNISKASDYPPRRTLRWAKLEEKDAGDGIDYRFYWDDWADNVPICQNVDDVFGLCKSLLTFVGLEIGEDAELLTKLARIGRKSLAEDPSAQNVQRWIDLSHTTLAPALTFSGRNPGVVNEVWDLFKHFDTATRYSIYKLWPDARGRQQAVEVKFAEISTETKRIFSRISTENTRAMGRALAKPAYACPGIVFQDALRRAEHYANMIDPLVECCRYLTYMGYDVLNWTFINAFSDPNKSFKQDDGMLSKPSLRNAAHFIGRAYKRYSLMDPTPVLQFVAHRLTQEDKPSDLFVLDILEQLIISMGGIGPVLALTESQVHGLSAGPLLRAHTLEVYLGDKRHAAKTTGRRLLKCLKDAGLATLLLVALAQEFERFPYRADLEEDKTPLKVVGNNLDNLYSNFAQYLDFLRFNLSVHEFDVIIPNIVELMSEYGLGPGTVFTICRPSLSIPINAARADRKKPVDQIKKKESPKGTGVDASMSGNQASSIPISLDIESESLEQYRSVQDVVMKDEPTTTHIEMTDMPADERPSTPNDVVNTSPANAEIETLASQLKIAMPDIYGDHICLIFFVTFWQLSLADVFMVTSMKEMNEYSKAWKHFADKANKVTYDRRDVSVQAVERRRAEIQGYNDQSAALRKENAETLEGAMKMREHLRAEMSQWFDGIPMVDARSEELHNAILQDCFLPRILLSSQDAQFAFAMVKTMHEIGVPGFRTMKFLDQLFKQRILTNVIFMCSSREAQNLGRFLNDLLKELGVWHSTPSNYTKSACGPKRNLPGFGRTFNQDRSPATFLDYEDFRRVMFKWHTQIFRALESCFKSDEYMHIRNAINVLKAIAPAFPKVDQMGKALYQTVQHLSQNDSREDLKLAALSLLGDLKKSEKRWVLPQNFHHSRNAPATASATNSGSRPASEQPKTPQPTEISPPKLNAAASNFTPRPVMINGAGRSKDTEDGEVGDDRQRYDTYTEARAHDTETDRPTSLQNDPRSPLQSQHDEVDRRLRVHSHENRPTVSSSLAAPPVPRPDNRASSRVPHNLPPRPDHQQPPRGRPSDRVPDRSNEFNAPPGRNNATPDYGRLERAVDQRDSFAERRELSPGRRVRGRTPERRDQTWAIRDSRDSRDFQDDRGMRPPPRDLRGPPSAFPQRDPRDVRDMRDARDPRDIRDGRDRGPPLPSSADGRARLHSNAPTTPDDGSRYRREYQPSSQQGTDRGGNLPPRQPPSVLPASSLDRPPATRDGPPLNPERAALIQDDRGRPDGPRLDRDGRHDRAPRTQSPRRSHERGPAPLYPPRSELVRDVREDRTDRPAHDRTPDHIPSHRDWREDPAIAPIGPRAVRNDSHSSGRVPRDIFNPPSRPSSHQAQDPNYGRLNPPNENAPPSGPRSTRPVALPTPTTNNAVGLVSDRRDTAREQIHPPTAVGLPSSALSATQPPQTNVHPSRLSNIGAAPLQTTVNIPSGPRGPGRTPLGPASSSPLGSRGPPTGPAIIADRNARNQPPSTLRAINNVLSGNQAHVDANSNGPTPTIRGRGGTRSSGFNEATNVPNPIGSTSHPSTPNAPRPEASFRVERPDNRQDDNRGHRDDRRGERSGRGRSRSPERGDRRGDERTLRGATSERAPRSDDMDRGNNRERGSGREKRGSDRDNIRRDREREGEHSLRDRRERSGREEGRVSGRGEDPGSRRGPPSGPSELPGWQGEGRGVGEPRARNGVASDRRDDRGDKRRDDPRDGRKRGANEEMPALNNHRDKRMRR